MRIFLLTSMSLFTVNILFTFSRVTWIATLCSMFMVVVFMIHKKNYTLRAFFVPIFLIFATIALICTSYHTIFFTRVVHDSQSSHNSLYDRSLYIEQAKSLITNHPFIGSGLGNYTRAVQQNDTAIHQIWYYQPVHNIFLLITAEIGVIGIVLFFIFLFIVHT